MWGDRPYHHYVNAGIRWGLVLFLLGVLAFTYYFTYTRGSQVGYAKCLKANPPMTSNFHDNSKQIVMPAEKEHFLGANIWRLKVSLW
jgi:hypothetical protein